MITSHKMTIRNNKKHVTIDDMFKLLYVEYLKNVKSNRGDSIYNSHGELKSNICSSDLYDPIISIILSRKIFDFLDWKPYVKTVNLHKLVKQIRMSLNLNWSDYYFRRSEIPFREKDHQINILWYLWEKDIYFEDIKKVPKTLRKLTRIVLYFDYYIEKIFEADYKQDEMKIFSNDPKEKWNNSSYYDRYGRYHYRQPIYHEQNIEFDYHEFNTRYNSSLTTGDYILYSMTNSNSANNATVYVNTEYTTSNTYEYDTSGTSNGMTWGI